MYISIMFNIVLWYVECLGKDHVSLNLTFSADSSKKTRTRPRKKELAQENTHSTKKASTKIRTGSRKHALVHEKKIF